MRRHATAVHGLSLCLSLILSGACYDAASSSLPEASLFFLQAETSFNVFSGNVGGMPNAVALSSDSIYIAGNSDPSGGNRNWRISRRNRFTGELVSAFGNGGVIEFDPGGGGNDDLNDMAYDNGFLYLVGVDVAPGSPQWRIEKRNAISGALDASFGTGGVISFDPVAGQFDNLDAILTNGSVMNICGSSSTGGSGQQWRMERRALSSGALDVAFGAGGVLTQAAGNGTQSRCWAAAADASSLYFAGAYRAATVDWRTEKRDRATGALNATFGAGGQVNGAPNPMRDEIYAVKISSDSIYVAGLASSPTTHYRLDRYDINSGASVAAFGSAGTVDVDYSSGADNLGALVLDGANLYLIGSDEVVAVDRAFHIERFDSSSGAAIAEFGNAGVLRIDLSPGNDEATAAVADGSFLYVAGADASTTPGGWRIIKMYKSSGLY
ncbi:MAG: hypothetical protein K1X75_18280 [Leptospirales bacterium]|nr:hypothetical protein [Leptospirales bacterium]